MAAWDYGAYLDEVLVMYRDVDHNGSLEPYYYLQDDLYNVIGLTDASGTPVERYAYDDYGTPAIYSGDGATLRTASAYGNPFLFQGRRWDETLHLYDYRTRYYDPALGRFLRIDTLGLWGDANNLGNPYSFVGSNPWSRVDPWGLEGSYFRGLISEPFSYYVLGGPEPYGSINAETLQRYMHPKASEPDSNLDGTFGASLPDSGNSAYDPEMGQKLGEAYKERLHEVKDVAVATGSLCPGAAGMIILGASAAIDAGEGNLKGATITGAGMLTCGSLKKISSETRKVIDELPELRISAKKYPELAENIRHAQKAGHPEILTHGGNGVANRTAATRSVPKIHPYSRDKYPFASSMEGGEGSWIGYVPPQQQYAQGGLIREFVRKHNLQPGDLYKVTVSYE